MQAGQILSFGPYRLDLGSTRLWRGKQEVRLTGKAFAVLRHLVTHTGELVTKDELFQAVWPGTVVSDDALTSCIKELRQVLRDQARERRYIETVYRREFRFIGTVGSSQYPVVSSPSPPTQPSGLSTQHSVLVGRETELAQLQGWWAKAQGGERQIVFVTGEPGIGKTALVEAFLSVVRAPESQEDKPQAKSNRQQAKRGDPSPAPSTQPLAPSPLMAHGQCVEHYGAGEAYLPMLEALGRLCQEADGQKVTAILRQQAPTWLVQMPALLSTAELEELQRRTAGTTRERMLRELTEALEALTAERALILRLEDLHWGDYSTLDLLSVLARWQEAARLLIVGTYRPVEVLTRDHPLKGVKQELQLHGQCEELVLDFLSEADVAEYLMQRFGPQPPHPVSFDPSTGSGLRTGPLQRGGREPFVAGFVAKLAHVIHRRTDGNPLFMVNVVNDLVAQGVLAKTSGEWELRREVSERTLGTPLNLRQLIEQQIERVSPEAREVLEAASVAGAEFSATAVAAGTGQSTEVVETHCDTLVRREQFLRAQGTGEWPDGTVAARYGFVHALYQEVLYERLTARRRQQLHQRIGERAEAAYGDRAGEIAAELAVHFERGREYRKAIQYLHQAGENAARRSAHQEAISLFTKGLELLNTLPDTPERTQQELTLQVALGSALVAIKGYTAPEVEQAWTRARELCQQVGESPQLFWVLVGLWNFSFVRAQFQTTRERAEQLLTLAQSGQDQALLLQAHHSLGTTLFVLGEFMPAREHLEQSLALYYSQKHRFPAFVLSSETGVDCLSYVAWVLWFLGYPDQALKRSDEALALAQELARPFPLAFALYGAAQRHLSRRETEIAKERAEAMIALSNKQGFPFWLAMGTVHRGSTLVKQGQLEEGKAQMRQGMAALQAIGTEAGRPGQLAQLAWAYGQMGQAEEGIALVKEALATVNKTGERVGEAGMYVLKGELLLAQEIKNQKSKMPNPQSAFHNPHSEAEECFLKAIDIARKQQARSLELRAVMSLVRLRQHQAQNHAPRTMHHETRKRLAEAHKMLSESYTWFTEGFDTKDLQEAKMLLEELDH